MQIGSNVYNHFIDQSNMIVIKNLEVQNYRNIKNAHLNDLSDLNILIGPNNCGKTNILELIYSLRLLQLFEGQAYLCPKCTEFTSRGKPTPGMILPGIKDTDYYLRDPAVRQITLRILFDEEQTERVASGVLEQEEERLSSILRGIDPEAPFKHILHMITMRPIARERLAAEHLSPFIHSNIIPKLVGSALYCEDRRLERYNQKDFVQYLQEKGLRSSQKARWIAFLSKIVDARIVDEMRNNLVRRVEGEDLEVSLSEQGSGVRSLACLTADLLFTDAKVVLIDEPELGLNPFAKQEFLKFLVEESEKRQIFLATHDPTFVNPGIWKSEKVSVFFYSLVEDQFVKIDLAESKEDPDTFAGYMPHTTSLKDTHMYVEGGSDVYIFQIFLRKYLEGKYDQPVDRLQIWNKLGIYHLAGNFWQHLLYTVPSHPYRCVVVLDGDKKEEAALVSEKFSRKELNVARFNFCQTYEELEIRLSEKKAHPIYCLHEDCIEEYLDPKPDYKDPNYDKKKKGCEIAEDMPYVPEEIRDIFDAILQPDQFGE